MITQRVGALRAWMSEHSIAALVIPTMDPHNSEYVPEHWQCRQWATGFTGSAGTAVLTQADALLWADSRYWLQAADQLRGTPYRLMRDLVDPSIREWLGANVSGPIGYPRDMMTSGLRTELFDGLQATPLDDDPFDALWTDRPAFPKSLAERMPDALAGETSQSKLSRLTHWMEQNGRDELLVSDLSEIMWTLNLRGDDIPYTPVLICFLLVRRASTHILYIAKEQIPCDIEAYLAALNVEIRPYEDAPQGADEPTPISPWRAKKTLAEQDGFREAHVRDGIAMVRFLRQLDESDLSGWTEMYADRVLTSCRAEQPGFRGLSFETIAGYGAHGAVVHYKATTQTDAKLEPRSLLLIDSGGHYDCGSTDITRTIALGELTDEEKRVYTLVLKGHLQLMHIRFPEGTVGLQLDTAARTPLWQEGLDYGHGTGHGVGHRLGIHEGPVQMRKNCRRDTTLPIQLGQNITDEPGIYVEGRFGVRHENTLLVVEAETNDFGRFLRFESLTLCPYDLRPIVPEMLTPQERRWLNAYHKRVFETLSPRLNPDDRRWLQYATRAI